MDHPQNAALYPCKKLISLDLKRYKPPQSLVNISLKAMHLWCGKDLSITNLGTNGTHIQRNKKATLKAGSYKEVYFYREFDML